MNPTFSILVVDDHIAICSTLKDILEQEGYTVTTANSGSHAVDICKTQDFDVILMDVRMPELNGVEAYRLLKNNAPKSRVIMMSAYSVDELKKEALKEGAIAFVQKPVDVAFVLKLIECTDHPPALIVMDDKMEREQLAENLASRNYRTHTVGGAEEALELASQIKFDIIMIDTRLHTMSALELYLALKKITPTSVTVLFAETDERFVKEAEEVVKRNAYTFLTKPLDLEKLFSILETIKRQMNSKFLEKPGV